MNTMTGQGCRYSPSQHCAGSSLASSQSGTPLHQYFHFRQRLPLLHWKRVSWSHNESESKVNSFMLRQLVNLEYKTKKAPQTPHVFHYFKITTIKEFHTKIWKSGLGGGVVCFLFICLFVCLLVFTTVHFVTAIITVFISVAPIWRRLALSIIT